MAIDPDQTRPRLTEVQRIEQEGQERLRVYHLRSQVAAAYAMGFLPSDEEGREHLRALLEASRATPLASAAPRNPAAVDPALIRRVEERRSEAAAAALPQEPPPPPLELRRPLLPLSGAQTGDLSFGYVAEHITITNNYGPATSAQALDDGQVAILRTLAALARGAKMPSTTLVKQLQRDEDDILDDLEILGERHLIKVRKYVGAVVAELLPMGRKLVRSIDRSA